MAVRQMSGWETGDITESNGSSGTFAVQGTTVRSGAFALQVNPTTSNVGYVEVQSYNTTTGAPNIAFNAADLYFQFYFRYATKPGTGDEVILLSRNSSSALKFELRLNSSGNLAIYDTTPALVATGSTVLAVNTWYRITLSVGTGATAAYDLNIDGVDELSGTLDATVTNHDNVRFGKVFNRNSQTVDFFYDDIVISDSAFPSAGAIVPLLIDGDGNYTTWTVGAGAGADFENIDDLPHDSDTTYLVSTDSVGDAQTASLISSATAGISGTIHAVKQTSVVKRDGASNGSVLVRTRSGSTDSDLSAVASTPSYGTRLRIMETDPTDAGAWTTGKLDALEIGFAENSATLRTRWTSGLVQVFFTAAGGGGATIPIMMYHRLRGMGV